MIWTTPGRTWKYILRTQRELPEEQQVRFVLQSLDADAEAGIQDLGTIGGDIDVDDGEARNVQMQPRVGKAMLETLRLGLVGVENLRDQDGETVVITTERVHLHGKERTVPTKEFLSGLDGDVRKELAIEISNKNTLTEADQKNSQSPPQ